MVMDAHGHVLARRESAMATAWSGTQDMRSNARLGWIDDASYRFADGLALSGSSRLELSRSRQYSARGGGPADGEALDHVEEL